MVILTHSRDQIADGGTPCGREEEDQSQPCSAGAKNVAQIVSESGEPGADCLANGCGFVYKKGR